MKSHNICLLRGVSSWGRPNLPPHPCMLNRPRPRHNFYSKLRLTPENCGGNPTSKSAYTSASFSLPLEYINQSEYQSILTPASSNNGNQCFTSKQFLPKSKIKNTKVAHTNHSFDQWYDDQNIHLEFGDFIKPISLSSEDNSKIENVDKYYKNSINERLDARSFYTCIKFDKNIVDILPRILSTSAISPLRETYISEGQSDVREETTSCATAKHFHGLQNPHVLYCSSSAVSEPKRNRKPSEEELTKVFNSLSEELPNLFVKTMNYSVYSPNVEFDNKITDSHSVGIMPYVRKVSFLRLLGHMKFAFVKFEILKITQHPENNTVRVRWRIVGTSALRSLPMVFKLKSFSLKEATDKMEDWYDGFSTFYVGENGLIYKHVADKMIPDEEMGVVKKPSLAARLVSLVGLSPKTPAPSGTAVTSSAIEHEHLSKEKTQLNSTSSDKSLVVAMLLGEDIENVGDLENIV